MSGAICHHQLSPASQAHARRPRPTCKERRWTWYFLLMRRARPLLDFRVIYRAMDGGPNSMHGIMKCLFWLSIFGCDTSTSVVSLGSSGNGGSIFRLELTHDVLLNG